MAGQKDFLDILREVRGSAAPGQPLKDGIWYELTVADTNGNPGIYGDILAKYGIVTDSAGTFDQAVAILENLNVEVTTLPAGSDATSALVNGVWQIGLPRGIDGTQGIDGSTPEVTMAYDSGNLNYTVAVDGTVVTNANLLNLDALVDSKVSTNVGVYETLQAKQDVLDAVATAQGISDSFEANVVTKKQEITDLTETKKQEILDEAEFQTELVRDVGEEVIQEFDEHALHRTNQYNNNHNDKLNVYNINDTIKMLEYNANHIERLENINYAYADRIVEMIRTRNFMGILDEYVAKTATHMITFLDTTDANYIYYANGTLLAENVDYTVYDSKTIELTVKANPYDVIVQVNTQILADMLTSEGVLFEYRIGQPNGVAGLNEYGQVPAEQLPSYVDDVLEFPTYADLPVEGETDKIYIVVTDETSNGDASTYRWTGVVYAMVSNTLDASDVKALYEANPDTNAYTDAEKSKLADIEDGATADQTADEILTLLKTVDGSGSELDADLLDGQEGAYYLDASNINTGTLDDARLPDTITSDITGNAATSTKLETARVIGGVSFDGTADISLPGVDIAGNQDTTGNASTATKLATAVTIALAGDVSGNIDFDGSANVTIETTIQPESVALGTDTTGNYMIDITAGRGIDVVHTQGEGSTATITNIEPNVTTNITTTHNSTNVVVHSSDGTDGTINSATQTLAGVMSADDKIKLDVIEEGATRDQTAEEIKIAYESNNDTNALTDSLLTLLTTNKVKNIATDSLNNRLVVTYTDDTTAELNINDIITDVHVSGATLDATTNVLTLTSTEGGADVTVDLSDFVNSSELTTALSNHYTKNESSINFEPKNANIQLHISSKSNPHNVTKAQVGLGNVNNTSDADKPVSTAMQSALNLKANDNIVVKLTGDQTIAGVKTFTSSPIIPVPKTDFQPVPLRSTNITVNVGAGQTYTTINQALEYLSGFYPMYKKSGVTATINLKSGFVMAEQVLVRGIDLGWITIVGENAETNITHTALTTDFTSADYGFSSYPAFGVSKGGTLPQIGQLFNMNLGISGASSGKHGVMTVGAGSSADILSGNGVKNAGTNGILAAQSSTIDAQSANASGAGTNGIHAAQGSTIDAQSANASGAGTNGIYAAQGSTINAQSANASGAGTSGIHSTQGSTIDAQSANASGAGTNGIYATQGSTINAQSANASGAGTNGIHSIEGSTINAQVAIIQNQTTGTSCIKVAHGATVEARNINTTGSTVTILSQAVNTLTGNGIIYQ